MDNENKKLKNFSGAKIAINAIVVVLILAGLILTSFFFLSDFNLSFGDKNFWTQKVILAILTFMIMLSVSNITEETLKKNDNEFTGKLDLLSTHYTTVCKQGRTDPLKAFIGLKNKKKKYEDYIRKNKTLANLFKKDEKKLKYYKRIVKTPDEVWETPNAVKYPKIVYAQLISGVADIPRTDDENDLSVHKMGLALKKAFYKVLLIITLGGFAADLGYGFTDFDKTMIVPLIFKIISSLVAVYAGISFGYLLNDRTKVVLKKKLAIYSEFNSFFDENGKEIKALSVPITIDNDIEVIKTEIERIEKELNIVQEQKTEYGNLTDKVVDIQ